MANLLSTIITGGSGTTPTLVLDRNIATPSNYYNGVQLEVKATSGTAGISLHRSGYSHVGIFHDSTNELKFNMNSGTPVLLASTGTIWGSGNDGSGSGLDADLIDGNHASAFATRQDGARYTTDFNSILSSGFFNAEGQPANAPDDYGQLIVAKGVDTGLQIFGGYNSNNLWFRGWGYGPEADGFYPWRKIWHDGNDGSGSGLDADLLDGIESSRIVYGGASSRQGVTQISDWNQTAFPNAAFLSSESSTANAPTTDYTYGLQTSFHRNGPEYRTQFVTSLYGNNVYWLRQFRDSAAWSPWVQVIHSGNIGAQSVSYAASAGVVGTADYAVTAGNASTVSSITGNTGLMINRLTPTSFIDGLTTSTFRSSLFNTTSSGAAISAARWNSVPAPLSGMGMYGTMIAWSGDSDTHGFVATDYNAPIIKVGGGYGNIIAWTATLVHSSNIADQSVSYSTSSGNSATVGGRSVGNGKGNVGYFNETGNLYINDPESYSGEVRLGAAWDRGGVYASRTLSLSTGSSEIHFVFSNSVPIYVNSSGSIIGNGTINFTGKSHYLGASNSWDNIGFGSLTNLHFQGHPQFWVGAGNAYWWSGGIATEHDLLISTMQGYDSTSYYRGITFAVDVNGNGSTGGYRLGRWQTHNTDWKTSRLQVDASLSVGYGNRTNRAFDEAKYPLGRGVWGHGRDDSGYGDDRIRDLLFSPTTNGGGPWGSFASLEVSSVYDGNSDVPALFRMHQWGSGAAEFWKPKGTVLYLRETPGGGSTWFTRFEVQGQLTVTGTSELNSLQLGSAPSDTSNLKLDVQGNMAIRGSNGLYFGVSTNNYNSWSTRIYASGSTQYFNAQQFIFDNQGYGGTTFATINSSGLSVPNNFVSNNYVSNYFNLESSRGVAEFGNVGMFRVRRSATADYPSFSFQHQYGNHSWGQIARFHIEGTDGSDRPSIQFSSGYNNTRWNVGYCYNDDNFRISQNMGYRPDMSGNYDSWGTERFRINTDGSMYCFSSFTASGDVTAYSDIRVKDNIETIPNAIDKVKSIRGVTFTRTDNDDNKKYMGVIAQELLNVIPEVVSETDSGMYTVAYGNITAVLIEAIKEQQKQIDELKAKIDGLTN